MMLILLFLLSTITAKPQAAYQLFSLSPFRLDFSGHQIQEARFQGIKRSAEASLESKNAQVLLLLPEERSTEGEALKEAIETSSTVSTLNQEPTTIHPKVLHLKEKADVIVIERAEKQKEKYHFNGRWEENVPEGSGDEPVTQDSVIEVNGVQGIDDVEPLTEKTTIGSEFTKKAESLDIAKKSSKLSPLNEIISKKLNEKKRVKELSESLDETEIEKSEEKDEKTGDEGKLTLKEAKSDLEKEKLDVKTEDSIEIRKKINSTEEMHESQKVIDGGSEEKAETRNQTTTTTATTATTETSTTPSKPSKQFWPTEVVIEGREFYLVPKNGRARDYLEPYGGGGYFLKKSPQDWFRGLHEQLRRETSQE